MNLSCSRLCTNFITFLIVAMASPNIAAAQANPELHAEGMKRISFLEGTWGGSLYKKLKDGTFVISQTTDVSDPDSTKLTTFTSIFNGNYYRINGKAGFNFSMTIGYDQWRDKYVMVSFEDGPGLVDIYQGNFNENGELVLSNFEAGTHYVQNGIKYYNRMIFTNVNSDDFFTWFIEGSTDGTNWNKLMRYDLKK